MGEIAEWGLNGRIIYVCETDNKVKRNLIKDILAVVDRDLGFSSSELIPKSLVYLGIARNQIVGVCVAQPLQEANRFIHKDGLDCCSTAVYPVKYVRGDGDENNSKLRFLTIHFISLADAAYHGSGSHRRVVVLALHRN